MPVLPLTLAESGAETVEQTRVGMESLKERVREIAEQIINLSEQTEQIFCRGIRASG